MGTEETFMKKEEVWELQEDTYKTLAGDFDNTRNNRNHINKIKAINNFFQLQPGQKILEVGVGTGIHASYIVEQNPDVFFYGADISDDMLEVAKKKLPQKSTLLKMMGEELKFEDNFFDAVYISGSLHHFANPKAGINELLRVCKKEGKFCIMEPNIIFPTNLRAAYTMPEERNMRLMTKRNFKKWLEDLPVSYSIKNFAYTPPFPVFLLPLFNIMDKIIKYIPLLNKISVMLFVSGKKNKVS